MSYGNSSLDLSPQEFSGIQRFLVDTIGLYYDQRRKRTIEAALKKRMDSLNVPSFRDYFRLLRTGSLSGVEQSELKDLLILLTIGETAFFRSPDQFTALREHILPRMIAKRSSSGKTLRLWSAGCSTGEEPYSLAITVREVLGSAAGWDIRVLASDINLHFLEVAQKGRYSPRSLRYVETDAGRSVLAKYFVREGETYAVTGDIRNLVTFFPHNLVRDPYALAGGDGAPLDVIFCRNVLIYFDRDTTRAVVEKFHPILKDDGYLFVGYSESLFHLSRLYKTESRGEAFFYRKKPPSRREGRQVPARPPVTATEAVVRPVEGRSPAPTTDKTERLPAFPVSGTYEDALTYMREDDFDSGIHILRELAEKNGKDPLIFLTLGNVNLDRNNIPEAIGMYRRALDIDPLSKEGRFLLALALWKARREDEALEELKRALFIDKDFALAYYYVGLINEKRGDRDRARWGFDNAVQAVERKPDQGSLSSFVSRIGGDFFPADTLAWVCREKLLRL